MKFSPEQQNLMENVLFQAKEYKRKGFVSDCDLHSHSTYSDGKFTPKQLAWMAAKIGLHTLYITDHNTHLNTYLDVKAFKDQFDDKLSLHVGVEIAVKIEDKDTGRMVPIEILAYHIKKHEQLQDFLDQYSFSAKRSQTKDLAMLQSICSKLNLVYDHTLVVTKNKFATEVLCKDLIQHEENKEYFMQHAPIVWTEPKLFYKKLVANPHSDFYMDTIGNTLPYYQDAIQAIHQAGGIAVVAHPWLYVYQTEEEVTSLLDQVCQFADGLEWKHSAHTPKQIAHLKAYADTHHIQVTGGTDFHKGPETIMGYGKREHPLSLKRRDFSGIE